MTTTQRRREQTAQAQPIAPVAALLADSAQRVPERTAVRTGDMALTYAELWEESRRYAGLLVQHGVTPGDRVALLLPNTPQFLSAYYGVLIAGAVVVPVPAMLRSDEIRHILSDSGAVLLLASAPLLGEALPAVQDTEATILTLLGDHEGVARIDLLAAQAAPLVPASRSGADLAVIIYTSGTTGAPKGAMITHDNIVSNVRSVRSALLSDGQAEIVLCCLPLFHAFGQQAAMNVAVLTGGTLVLVPRFDPDAVLTLLAEAGVTMFAGVPTMYVALVEAAARSSRRPTALRLAISGGAALPAAVLERFQAWSGVDVCEGYGLSETTCVATVGQPSLGLRPGTVGHAISGVEIGVADPDVDDTIRLLGTDILGEIVIRGDNVMQGYLGKPLATAEAIVDGWFRSGDLGTVDADGFVRIVDRKKDLIIRGGFNVYPREVEEVLQRHEHVSQVAVVGVPDERYGEEVVAVVVPALGADVDAAELVAWARARLGGHKHPRAVVLVDALPLGPSGKVLKRELRNMLTARSPQP